MNVDTSDLAVLAYQVWNGFRHSFLRQHKISDDFHKKYFARLDAKQGLTAIMKNLLDAPDPLVCAQHYIKCAQLTPVDGTFLSERGFGFESKENEKKNLHNFFSFMQTVFQKPITNSEAMIIFAQGWPDIIKTLQEKCENSVNEKTGYRCEAKWSDICENAHSKIFRELNNCISKCAMLNENTVCYLLTHHLEAEDISARVRDIVARKQVRFFYDDNKTIDVKHYTMMCVVDEIWETMLNAIKWDMECLEASFKNLVKEHQPIAIYGEKRHNM